MTAPQRAAETGLIRKQAIAHNDDYGDQLSATGPLAEENTFRYTGEQFDAETGMYYLRNRYYQPEFGRFLQRDPIRYGSGPNMMAYCSGDPINNVDPSGLQELPLWLQNKYPDPNAASFSDVQSGAESHARGWLEFLLFFAPLPKASAARSAGAGRFVQAGHLVRAGVPVRIARDAKYLEKELKAAQYFGDLGYQFEITKTVIEAPGADAWLISNGVRVGYDIKTLEAATNNALVKTVKRLSQGSVSNAIIDGRVAGLTQASAISWAKSGVSRFAGSLQEIRIITTGGEVVWLAK